MPIIAWDGEGMEIDGRHRYVLLGSSTGARALNLAGLPMLEALNVLAAGLAQPGVHVGFALTYDVSMLLRRLPRASLEKLYRGLPLIWGARDTWYRLSWRPRHYLKLHTRRGSLTWKGGTLWDVWGFFQRSFSAALEDYHVGTPAERQLITRWKKRRRTFTPAMIKQIERYHTLELRLLVQLMERVRDSLQRAKLSVARWDGPGAAASKLLQREGAKQRRPARPPPQVETAARHAYYGGRSECVQYGHARVPVYQYDITSAYPHVMASAPCTSKGCGYWEHVGPSRFRDWTGEEYAVHRVRWAFTPADIYPWPWRAHHGGVYFPQHGEGWVWTPELLIAPPAEFDIMESWRWVSECKHKELPYAWVERVYAERQAAVKRGDPAERALKMALVCLYGKLAQRAGAERVKGKGYWRRPAFHDLCLAGWITSSTRARLFEAARTIPGKVLMLSTDAVFALVPLPATLTNDPKKPLGGWTVQQWAGATIVQSGLYWLHKARTAHGQTRGVDSDAIDWRDAVRAWRRGQTHIEASVTRFTSVGRATQSGWGKLASWREEPRNVAVHPWETKRIPVVNAEGRPVVRPDRGFCPTIAADTRRYHRSSALTTPTGVPWAGADPDPETRHA